MVSFSTLFLLFMEAAFNDSWLGLSYRGIWRSLKTVQTHTTERHRKIKIISKYNY